MSPVLKTDFYVSLQLSFLLPSRRMALTAGCACVAAALLLAVDVTSALAQMRHPFAIGANEGAVGNVGGIGAWIIAQEGSFYRRLAETIKLVKDSPSAGLALAALSFAYGVFHAAGPGHGKAVITSYMVSNEQALRRGFLLSLLAALLQGLVAIGLVGSAALIFHLTAPAMTKATGWLEIASYGGIVLLGGYLLWRKGLAFVKSWQLATASAAPAFDTLFATAQPAAMPRGGGSFLSDDGVGHVHGPDCGHFHGLAPADLEDGRFAWKAALLTIVTAGLRPCSGAILVLVFALAQGVFLVGIGATFAMSLGTALTTGALAAFAVFAKRTAMRFVGEGSSRAALLGRFIEVLAALCVLAFGLLLLAAQWQGNALPSL